MLVLFYLLSCSTMLLAPLEWSLGLSVLFVSSHRDKKPVANTPKKRFCDAQSAVGKWEQSELGAFADSLPLLWAPEGHSAMLPGCVFAEIFHCCVPAYSAYGLDPASTPFTHELILETRKQRHRRGEQMYGNQGRKGWAGRLGLAYTHYCV